MAQNYYETLHSKQISDSIRTLSQNLNGKWKLEGYYYAQKYVPKVREYIKKSDDLNIAIYQTKSGLVEITRSRNTIIKEEPKSYYEVIEFDFNTNGKGKYYQYSVFKKKDQEELEDEIDLESCQPFPEIVAMYERYFISYKDYPDRTLVLIESVNETQLILINEDNEKIKYQKPIAE